MDREFKEDPITREDRFMREMFVALIEEIHLLRQELREVKENESKGNNPARRKRATVQSPVSGHTGEPAE